MIGCYDAMRDGNEMCVGNPASLKKKTEIIPRVVPELVANADGKLTHRFLNHEKGKADAASSELSVQEEKSEKAVLTSVETPM